MKLLHFFPLLKISKNTFYNNISDTNSIVQFAADKTYARIKNGFLRRNDQIKISNENVYIKFSEHNEFLE